MKWIVVALALTVAGWMAFDGTRALVVGDYVTPAEGEYAGQLGPWADLVSKVGIEPRSTLMKSIFAVYGGLWLAIIVAFALRASGAWWGMAVAAAGSLWYLPFGTLLGVIQLVLLCLPSVRRVSAHPGRAPAGPA